MGAAFLRDRITGRMPVELESLHGRFRNGRSFQMGNRGKQLLGRILGGADRAVRARSDGWRRGRITATRRTSAGISTKTCYFSFDFDPGGVSIPPDEGWTPGRGAPNRGLGLRRHLGHHGGIVCARIRNRRLPGVSRVGRDRRHALRLRHGSGVRTGGLLATHHHRFGDRFVGQGVVGRRVAVQNHRGRPRGGRTCIRLPSARSGTPTTARRGAVRFDNASFELPRIEQFWVDASQTDCAERDGLSQAEGFCTIQEAADLAGPGTVVHILPGTYNEHVKPVYSGGKRRRGSISSTRRKPPARPVIDATGLECDGMNGVL